MDGTNYSISGWWSGDAKREIEMLGMWKKKGRKGRREDEALEFRLLVQPVPRGRPQPELWWRTRRAKSYRVFIESKSNPPWSEPTWHTALQRKEHVREDQNGKVWTTVVDVVVRLGGRSVWEGIRRGARAAELGTQKWRVRFRRPDKIRDKAGLWVSLKRLGLFLYNIGGHVLNLKANCRELVDDLTSPRSLFVRHPQAGCRLSTDGIWRLITHHIRAVCSASQCLAAHRRAWCRLFGPTAFWHLAKGVFGWLTRGQDIRSAGNTGLPSGGKSG